MDFRRLVLVAMLGLSLFYALYASPLAKRLFPKKAPRTAARVQAPVQAPTTPSAPAEVPKLTREALEGWRQRYAEAWRRDPFFTAEEEQALRAPKVAKAGASQSPSPLPSYTVKAVLISDSFKTATIDGRQVSEGEMLGEERVVEIQPDGVILERAGQRRRIQIVGGAVRLIEVEPRSTTKER